MNWEEYKKQVKETDPDAREIIENAEAKAEIVTAIINQRNALGLSQRDLAKLCDMPQSSVARIESAKTTPNLDTLLKIFRELGLKFNVSTVNMKNS